MHIRQTIIKKAWNELDQKYNLIQVIQVICKFTITSMKTFESVENLLSHEVIVFQLLSANIGQLWLKITENWSTWIDERQPRIPNSRAERLSGIFG